MNYQKKKEEKRRTKIMIRKRTRDFNEEEHNKIERGQHINMIRKTYKVGTGTDKHDQN